jgi:hypothetical protein
MDDLLFLGFFLVKESIFEFLYRQYMHTALFDLSIDILKLIILVLGDNDKIDKFIKILCLLAIHFMDVVPDRHAIQYSLCTDVHLIIIIDKIS